MLRIEMKWGFSDEAPLVFEWFLHHVENQWLITINEPGDQIRSVPAIVSTEPKNRPALTVAELWSVLRNEHIELLPVRSAPRYIQAETRVVSCESRFWTQANVWIWQDEQVVAYRSHPSAHSKARAVPRAEVAQIAQAGFDLAADLESDAR
jgi:hypothetical protein